MHHRTSFCSTTSRHETSMSCRSTALACNTTNVRGHGTSRYGVRLTAQPLLAVDAPSLYFRAFHGIPEQAGRTSAGEPVNAVRGFLDMIAQLVRTRRPG